MSVNYLHFGAPKMWYSVSPHHAAKFDAMAAQLFPRSVAACPAFVRHKDIMISPAVLKSFNIPFVQAKQRAGEFIVLNAAAYHAGFNTGFNCAEAINFALESWLPVGKNSVSCECGALPDSVQLDMSIFYPDEMEMEEDGEEEDEEQDEEEDKAAKVKAAKGHHGIKNTKRKMQTNDKKQETSALRQRKSKRQAGRRRDAAAAAASTAAAEVTTLASR